MFHIFYFCVWIVGGQPCLDQLWFGNGPEVSALRLESFFFMFDCSEYTELYGAIENSLLAALCLVTYIVQQVVYTFLVNRNTNQWKHKLKRFDLT